MVLILLKKKYGLKNAAKAFWRELLRSFSSMVCSRINADPCMYFKWKTMELLVWLSRVDYCEFSGRDGEVKYSRNKVMNFFVVMMW